MSGEAQSFAAETQASMLDLIATHGEREVTFRGVTAPLGLLVNLCPVPKEDMDPIRVQVWASNILDESGVDYRQELRDQGLDVDSLSNAIEEAKKKLK